MAADMIKHIHLTNYRSFVDACVDLAPFTLVLGANGAGKTNFLNAFKDSGRLLTRELRDGGFSGEYFNYPRHFNHPVSEAKVSFTFKEYIREYSEGFIL